MIKDAPHAVRLIRHLRDRQRTGLEGLFGFADRSKHIDFCQVRLCSELGILLVLFDHPVDCRHGFFRLALAYRDIGQAALDIHEHPCVGGPEVDHLLESNVGLVQLAHIRINVANLHKRGNEERIGPVGILFLDDLEQRQCLRVLLPLLVNLGLSLDSLVAPVPWIDEIQIG